MTATTALPAATGTYETVGPGLAGFLAIFALAVVTVLLFRSMTGHLRKVRYGPRPEDEAPAPDGSADAAEPPEPPVEEPADDPRTGPRGEG
jgi:hypothetical protein